MNKSNDKEFDPTVIYATCWRMVYMSVHRYSSNPTGELLTVMTFSLLNKIGYHPTVSDLSRITGLNKSSVSRYVTRQMQQGYLREDIDPADRRLRRLVPTTKGRTEEEWHRGRTHDIVNLDADILDQLSKSDDPVSMLMDVLLGADKGRK